MVFGLAPSDIVRAIELGNTIYQTWFTRGNRADTQYREFGNSIKGLVDGLQQLARAFEEGYHALPRPDGDYHDPLDPALERDRILLIGDFTATLNDCEDLLRRKLSSVGSRDGVSFVTNGLWHLSTQPMVDSLRDRIQFHMTKMIFVTEPLKLGLLKDIASDIEIMRERMEDLHAVQISGVPPSDRRLPPIPPNLRDRFQEAFVSKPAAFFDGLNRSIELTFEALHRHFLRSTWSYRGPMHGLQTIEQYLNLIKAQYLVEKLQEEAGLSDRYYYQRSVARIERGIKVQFRRTDIIRYDAEELEGLDTKSFEIWTTGHRSGSIAGQSGVDSGVPEDEILQLSLPPEAGMSRQDLVIFRQSDVEFRLVQKIDPTAATGRLRERDYTINIHSYRYIPWYANPTDRTSSTRVQIRSSVDKGGALYTLKDQEDVRKFQHAIVGYHVACDKDTFTWNFHKDKLGQNRVQSQNRIQLWQGISLLAQKKGDEHRRSTSGSTLLASPGPSGSTAVNSTSVHSATREQADEMSSVPTISRSVTSGPGNARNQTVTSIKNPKPPVLFLFTMLDGSFAFIHIELSTQHHLWPESPGVVVLKYKNGAKFKFKSHSVVQGNLDTWDLALFATPTHPEFHKLKSGETRYLRLDFGLEFAASTKRRDFLVAFNALIGCYGDELKAINRLREERRYMSDHPGKATSPTGLYVPRSPSIVSTGSSTTTRSVASPAPRLPPLSDMSSVSSWPFTAS